MTLNKNSDVNCCGHAIVMPDRVKNMGASVTTDRKYIQEVLGCDAGIMGIGIVTGCKHDNKCLVLNNGLQLPRECEYGPIIPRFFSISLDGQTIQNAVNEDHFEEIVNLMKKNRKAAFKHVKNDVINSAIATFDFNPKKTINEEQNDPAIIEKIINSIYTELYTIGAKFPFIEEFKASLNIKHGPLKEENIFNKFNKITKKIEYNINDLLAEILIYSTRHYFLSQ